MDADVVVVGLGHTGLPMAVAAARRGLRVIGLDEDRARIDRITAGVRDCGLTTVSEAELAAMLRGPLRVRTGAVLEADVHVLCVPSRDLLRAVDTTATALRDGDLVIVQSTCPPGMIEDVVLPRMRRHTEAAFHLAHSPVRLDPGRSVDLVVPRVVAGMTPEAQSAAVRFLRAIGEDPVPVGSIRAAELTKVFENTFRLVNISLANELAAVCALSGVDAGEVLAAAGTKPYGFLRHDPGPGAGGDCVPVCAEFFTVTARRCGTVAATVEAAVAVNDAMPRNVVRQLPVGAGRVLVAGVSYKPDVADARRSAAVRIIEELRTGAGVSYHDPYLPSLRLDDGTVLHSQEISPGIADVVLLVTKHRGMDVRGFGAPVFDCSTGVPSPWEGRDA